MAIKPDTSKTCCFTGHRIIPNDEKPIIAERLIKSLKMLISEGYDKFISGGALGFDIMAAKAVIQLRTIYPDIKLFLALPCKNQSINWRLADRAAYDYILKEANSVYYLNEKYILGCMHERNRYMVDQSSVCIAYLTQESGGTAYTVKYAKNNNVKVLNTAHHIK